MGLVRVFVLCRSAWSLLLMVGFVLAAMPVLAESPRLVAPSQKEIAPIIQGGGVEQSAPEPYRKPLRAAEYDWQIIGLHEDFIAFEHAIPSCRRLGDIIYLRGTARVKSGAVSNARPLGHLPPGCRGKLRSYAGVFFQGPLRININAYQGVLSVSAWDYRASDDHRSSVGFDGIYFFAD